MPVGRKRIFLSKLTDVLTADKEGIGTRRREGDNEYIFLKGVASVADGTPVQYNESYAATILPKATSAFGPVAIANAAIVASRWGWFQIRGTKTSVAVTASAAADGLVYNDKSAAGVFFTTSSGNQLIAGINLTAAESSGGAPVLMSYPFVIA